MAMIQDLLFLLPDVSYAPIIRDYRPLDRTVIVQPLQEERAVPVLTGGFPVPIRPDDVGVVPIYQLIELWARLKPYKILQIVYSCTITHFLETEHTCAQHTYISCPVVAFVLQVQGVVPLVQGVIQPKSMIVIMKNTRNSSQKYEEKKSSS